MTEKVDLYVIARVESDCAVADLYSCDVWYDAADGCVAGRIVEGWWESVTTSPDAPGTLDALGAVLASQGYTRTSDWRKRVTASGAVRYFADATIRIEDLDR